MSRAVLGAGLTAITLMLLMTATAFASSAPETSKASATVALWPGDTTIGFGDPSKLAGTVKDATGDPVALGTVFLQYKDGATWKWLATVTTNPRGYFQHWFRHNGGNRTYRAKEAAGGNVSNTATITTTERFSIWNNFRPVAHYCEWTKVHGLYGGPAGPMANTTLYLQRKVGNDWTWQATVATNSGGYYSAWMVVCPSETLRVATEGSAVVTDTVAKTGSKIIPWSNSRVHAVVRNGFGTGVWGLILHLQKWDGSKWVWQARCVSSSSGYCNFGTEVPSGTLRVRTWDSHVDSIAFQSSQQ